MKLIGKGHFSDCWLLEGGKEVLLVGEDPAKEALASFTKKLPKPALWLPKTEKVGKNEYKQPFFGPLFGTRNEVYYKSVVAASIDYCVEFCPRFVIGVASIPVTAKKELVALLEHTEIETGLEVFIDPQRDNFSTTHKGKIVFRDIFTCG